MKLYFSPGACSMSPHIVLQESGLTFTLEQVDLKTHRTASGKDYFTINPKGQVPVLELDDGAILTEGPAIVQFLADRAPEHKLAPAAGSFERVQLQEWLNFISTELHKGFSPLWNAKTPEETKIAAWERLTKWLGLLEGRFATHRFVMGNDFSVADAYLYTVLNWTTFLKRPLTDWPAVEAYMARVAERPAVQRTLQAEGLAG
ncbi:MAG: glutathione transferase GstA [Burkholderiales bacterium]|nr:glutathione transferase GstA [Burkholderiales bacterium]